jgi:hypothetical protein
VRDARHGALVLLATLASVMVLTVTGASAIPADCTSGSPTCFRPNFIITGANPPDPFPWLTVEFEEVGGVVFMAMRADFADSSYIGKVWLNVANSAWLPSLTFDEFALNTGFLTAPTITKSSNGVSPTPGEAGQFDVQFNFANASANRFNGVDELQFRVTCAGCVDFDLDAFDALSTGGNDGAFTIAAHVQGFGDSSKVGGQQAEEVTAPQAIPFPRTLMLVGVGMLLIGVARSRRS